MTIWLDHNSKFFSLFSAISPVAIHSHSVIPRTVWFMAFAFFDFWIWNLRISCIEVKCLPRSVYFFQSPFVSNSPKLKIESRLKTDEFDEMWRSCGVMKRIFKRSDFRDEWQGELHCRDHRTAEGVAETKGRFLWERQRFLPLLHGYHHLSYEINHLALKLHRFFFSNAMWIRLLRYKVLKSMLTHLILEAGAVRAKNTTNILIKNLLDSCMSQLGLFLMKSYYFQA